MSTEILKKSNQPAGTFAIAANVLSGFDDALFQVAGYFCGGTLLLARRQRFAALGNRRDAEVGGQWVVLKWHATFL
jgi:hypothetical protein